MAGPMFGHPHSLEHRRSGRGFIAALCCGTDGGGPDATRLIALGRPQKWFHRKGRGQKDGRLSKYRPCLGEQPADQTSMAIWGNSSAVAIA